MSHRLVEPPEGQEIDVAPIWRAKIAAAVANHGQLKALAQAAGMTSPQLQKIANGTTRDPGVNTLARIALAMGVQLPELFKGLLQDTEEMIALTDREARQRIEKGEKTAPGGQHLADKRRQLTNESQVRTMPSSADGNGQVGAVPGETDLDAIRAEMRETTTVLKAALEQSAALSGNTVADRLRKAAKARAARTRKREKSRKDRRRGPGAA